MVLHNRHVSESITYSHVPKGELGRGEACFGVPDKSGNALLTLQYRCRFQATRRNFYLRTSFDLFPDDPGAAPQVPYRL